MLGPAALHGNYITSVSKHENVYIIMWCACFRFMLRSTLMSTLRRLLVKLSESLGGFGSKQQLLLSLFFCLVLSVAL